MSAATVRSSAGAAAPPRESEQAYRDTLIGIRAAVPLARGDQPRGTVPSPQAAANAPSRPPVATPADREELPIVGYDDLNAAVIVKQLSALTAAELSAVLAHEQAHRNRKTICQRIAALHASTAHTAPQVD